MLIIRIDVSVCECSSSSSTSSRWDEREMHLTPLLDCFSNSLAWKMHAFLNFFLDLIWKHTRKKVWDWLLQINMTYVNHVTLRRHKSFSFSTTSIQLWIFTIQTNSFQFQGPTSFSSPWLLDSSRTTVQILGELLVSTSWECSSKLLTTFFFLGKETRKTKSIRELYKNTKHRKAMTVCSLATMRSRAVPRISWTFLWQSLRQKWGLPQ